VVRQSLTIHCRTQTTESVVVERPEKDKAPAMPGGSGGMGDMYQYWSLLSHGASTAVLPGTG
jgi:hypothetical protein